jgi:hypothetical protein
VQLRNHASNPQIREPRKQWKAPANADQVWFPKPESTQSRPSGDWMRPLVKSGKLEIIPINSSGKVDARLRTVIPEGRNATFRAIYDVYSDTHLFDQLVSERLLVQSDLGEDPIKSAFAHCNPIELTRIDAPDNIHRVEYRAGQVRHLERNFDFLRGKSVENILVRDPYLFHSTEFVDALESILKTWSQIIPGLPELLTSSFGEKPDCLMRCVSKTSSVILNTWGYLRSESKSSHYRAAEEVGCRFPRSTIAASSIEFTVTEVGKPALGKRGIGKKETVKRLKAIVELSGGILRLVSIEKECCIYRFWSNA